MSHSLNSLKGGLQGGLYRGVLKGLLRGILGAWTMVHMSSDSIWGFYITIIEENYILFLSIVV